jgi:hypothetical protein
MTTTADLTGVGAISYVEYARRLLPDPGDSDDEVNHLTAAMVPVVYWLVFFSIVVHGLSIPVLNGIYKWLRVATIHDHPVEVLMLSENEPVPNNSIVHRESHLVTVNNRFSCISSESRPNHNCEESDLARLRYSRGCELSLDRLSSKESSASRAKHIREIV